MPATEKIVKLLRSFGGFDRVLHPVKIVSAGNGSLLAELEVAYEHVNFMDNLHGGYSATLIDMMTGLALATHERGAYPSVGVNINISYLGAAKIGDTIQIKGTTLKVGKSLAFLHGEIRNKQTGALLVQGSHVKFMLSDEKLKDF